MVPSDVNLACKLACTISTSCDKGHQIRWS